MVVVVWLLSWVWLFATPWTAEPQGFLSFTIPQSFLKLMSFESVMPSNFLILYRPLLPLPSVFPSIRVWCWSCNTLATQGEELICYYITDRYNMFCISTHLLTDIWAISTFQLSGIVLLWVFLHLNGWRGNSLAVQQLVLSTFTAGGVDSRPRGELRFHKPCGTAKKLNNGWRKSKQEQYFMTCEKSLSMGFPRQEY